MDDRTAVLLDRHPARQDLPLGDLGLVVRRVLLAAGLVAGRSRTRGRQHQLLRPLGCVKKRLSFRGFFFIADLGLAKYH